MDYRQHVLVGLAALVFHYAQHDYELDFVVLHLLGIFFSLCTLHTTVLTVSLGLSINAALHTTASLASTFAGTLTVSISIYRVFFHRLHHFPGPFMARLTKGYQLYRTVLDSRKYALVHEYHQKYGPVVRTGPRELSILSLPAIQAIYGASTTTTKSVFYNQQYNDGHGTLMFTRDKENFLRRRKAWDKAMNGAALRMYEPRMEVILNILIDTLEKANGDPVDWTLLARYYAFDMIGEVGVGKSYDQLITGKTNSAVPALRMTGWWVGVVGSMPWLFRVVACIPIAKIGGVVSEFLTWCGEQMDTTLKNGPKPDGHTTILDFLLYDEITGFGKLPYTATEDDCRALIAGGSDTAAGQISSMFYYLSQHPDVMKKLQKDLDEAFPNHKYNSKISVPYLDAIINESLRLLPALARGLPRTTCKEGMTIDGLYIPGYTIVSVPTYSIHRDPRYWERPNDFWPERWIKGVGAEAMKCFMPFTMATFVCPGRHLAWLEMRMILSMVVMRFDVTPDGPLEGWETGILDYFTTQNPELPLRFTKRPQYA
ncbi:cytochrome P450 [Pyronema domesticum]|nr:cytochrome P450 [Pyronema domesticum]